MYNAGMAVEYLEQSPVGPPRELGPYREADYWRLPDEPRCELLYGSLLVTPSPLVRHQLALGQLHVLFQAHAVAHDGIALLAPMDVRLADHSIVQPDLIYVTAARREVVRERIFGAPDLLVEILSPSTARRDLGPKMKLYADSGVAEYWIVDPEGETFEFLENRDGAFVVRLPEAGVYSSRAVAGLAIEIETFWTQVPR
jgi:Uma2 family endonuclease